MDSFESLLNTPSSRTHQLAQLAAQRPCCLLPCFTSALEKLFAPCMSRCLRLPQSDSVLKTGSVCKTALSCMASAICAFFPDYHLGRCDDGRGTFEVTVSVASIVRCWDQAGEWQAKSHSSPDGVLLHMALPPAMGNAALDLYTHQLNMLTHWLGSGETRQATVAASTPHGSLETGNAAFVVTHQFVSTHYALDCWEVANREPQHQLICRIRELLIATGYMIIRTSAIRTFKYFGQ